MRYHEDAGGGVTLTARLQQDEALSAMESNLSTGIWLQPEHKKALTATQLSDVALILT